MSLRYAIVNGRPCWVNEQGQVVSLAGADPGIGARRERDLMSRLPDADIVGLRGPGVVPGGEQSRGARHIDAQGEPPPPATYRPLAGAQQNNRGGTVIVQTTNGFGTSPLIVETPKRNGDDAELVTVTLGMTFPESRPAAPGIPLTAVCKLQWGVGGAIFNAELDWLEGLAFSVAASAVRIGADVTVGIQTAAVQLSAALAYGGMPLLSSSKRRTVAVSAAAASSQFIRIPPFATSFTPQVRNSAGGSAQPNCVVSTYNIASIGLGTPGSSWLCTANTLNAYQKEDACPLPNGAVFLRVQNLDAVNPANGNIIFNLSF